MSLSPKESFLEFEEMLSFPHLYEAYKKALKGKRLKKEVYEFGNNIIENLLNIQQKLLNNIFEFGPYRSFVKFDTKRRYIVATPFKDRIVHWVIYDYLVALYDKSFIYDSFGNRANKGTQAGMLRAKQFITKKDSNYILKIDFFGL